MLGLQPTRNPRHEGRWLPAGRPLAPLTVRINRHRYLAAAVSAIGPRAPDGSAAAERSPLAARHYSERLVRDGDGMIILLCPAVVLVRPWIQRIYRLRLIEMKCMYVCISVYARIENIGDRFNWKE